jgi:hypothetical protein
MLGRVLGAGAVVIALVMLGCGEDDSAAKQAPCKDLDEGTCESTPGCGAIRGTLVSNPCVTGQYVGCATRGGTGGLAITCTQSAEGGPAFILPDTRIPDGWIHCGAPYEECDSGAP